MRLLQLPVTDLEQAIKEEIEKNPLLEAEAPENEESFESLGSADNNSSDWDSDEDEFGYDYREHLESDPNSTRHEFVISDRPTQLSTLNSQLSTLNLTDRQRLIAVATANVRAFLSGRGQNVVSGTEENNERV